MNQMVNKDNNSSNSLVFARWPHTKISIILKYTIKTAIQFGTLMEISCREPAECNLSCLFKFVAMTNGINRFLNKTSDIKKLPTQMFSLWMACMTAALLTGPGAVGRSSSRQTQVFAAMLPKQRRQKNLFEY